VVGDLELVQPGQQGGVPVQRGDQPGPPGGQVQQPPDRGRRRAVGPGVQHAQRLGG
jgi:hypothetical protein